jgi:cytochrome bd-type quinol oxidase subunit 2
MVQRIKNLIVALAIALSGGMVLVPAVVSAADDLKGDACQGINSLNGSNSANCDAKASDKIGAAIKSIIQILSFIVGIAAVIMVIIGGLKFITANGDSGAIASARSTIIYALIGLVVVAIAQVLVHFVIRTVP